MRRLWLAGVALVSLACGPHACSHVEVIPFTVPPAVGEIGPDGAVVWARAPRPAFLHVALLGAHDAHEWIAPAADADRTGRVELTGLRDARQRFRAWLSPSSEAEGAPEGAYTAELRLAPPSTEAAEVAFGFGGDIGGQNVCRDVERGWPLVTEAARAPLDFFIVLGDSVYADDACTSPGRYGNTQIPGTFPAAITLDDFRAHYHYAEADPGFSALRARSYAVWDDHETMNDVGPTRDQRAGSEHLMPLGRRAFVEHAPLPTRWLRDVAQPLYRRVRWGRHLELFILDTRSYRDDNDRLDELPTPKTLLGATQRDWLIEGLTTSDATWRVVVSSVPIAIPTGFPPEEESDGWADGGTGRGYERELASIFEATARAGVPRLIFVTTDVHFATSVRYHPLPEAPDFVVDELVTGPMGAGLFPSHRLDDTFHPTRLFFHGPDAPGDIASLDEALGWMSWGMLRVSEDGHLRYEVRGVHESVLWSMDLDPVRR